jgi:hypothetical protein
VLCKIIENPEKQQRRTPSLIEICIMSNPRVYSTPNTLYYTAVTLPNLLLQLCTMYSPDGWAYAAIVTLDQWKLEGSCKGGKVWQNMKASLCVGQRLWKTFTAP